MRSTPALRSRAAFVASALGIAIALAIAIAILGRDQFPAADGSPVTSAAWRMFRGFEPYVDVVTAMPPLFLLGAGWAFTVGGVSWGSIVDAAALFAAATFLLHVAMLSRLGLSRSWALALAVVTQATTMLVTAFWWYNPITSVCACLFLTAAFSVVRRPDDPWSRGALVLSAILVALAKVNGAAVLLPVTMAILLGSASTRRVALGSAAGAVLGVLAILWLAGIDPLAMWSCYRLESGRLTDSTDWASNFERSNQAEMLATAVQAVPLFLLAGARGLSVSREDRPLAGLFAAGALTSAFGFFSNREYLMIDAAPMVLAAMLLLLLAPRAANANVGSKERWVAMALLGSLVVQATFHAVTRTRVASAGGGMFYQEIDLARLASPPFFRRLRTGPTHRQVLSDLESVLAEDREKRIYFNPRIAFAYPLHGIDPARGLPVFWDSFCDEERPGVAAVVSRFESADFDVLVSLRGDTIHTPETILRLQREEYDRVDVGTLTVHRRRRAP